MENPIQIFNHEQFSFEQHLAIIQDDGKVLFKAKLLTKALGYDNTNDAIIKHLRVLAKYYAPPKISSGR